MIELHTKLDSGIYASQGGGQDRVVKSWRVNARNLLAAIEALRVERRDNKQHYGNIGCGRSWVEVGGVDLDQFTLDDVDMPPKRDQWIREPSRTAKAADLLADITSGKYAANRAAARAMEDAEDRAAGWIA